MKIVVLMKQVPDTEDERHLDTSTGRVDRSSGEQVADDINERALEVALQYKDKNKGTEVIALGMGPEQAAQALRKGLQMGADSAVLISDPGLVGADGVTTAKTLATAAQNIGFDLLVTGNESTDGRGGVIPAMVAEILDVPLVGSLSEVEITAGSVSGRRSTDDGVLELSAALPAVLSVTEWSAEARFPGFKSLMAAKKKKLDVQGAAGAVGQPVSHVLKVAERPAKQAGIKIVDGGDAGEQLAEFLLSNKLI